MARRRARHRGRLPVTAVLRPKANMARLRGRRAQGHLLHQKATGLRRRKAAATDRRLKDRNTGRIPPVRLRWPRHLLPAFRPNGARDIRTSAANWQSGLQERGRTDRHQASRRTADHRQARTRRHHRRRNSRIISNMSLTLSLSKGEASSFDKLRMRSLFATLHPMSCGSGVQMTSSMRGAPSASMTRRSKPRATPLAAGMCESAARKSSSRG